MPCPVGCFRMSTFVRRTHRPSPLVAAGRAQDAPKPSAPKADEKKAEPKKVDPKDEKPPAGDEVDVQKTAERIAENAQKAGDRLKEKDPGADTRKIQQEILKDIDALLKKAQQPPPDAAGHAAAHVRHDAPAQERHAARRRVTCRPRRTELGWVAAECPRPNRECRWVAGPAPSRRRATAGAAGAVAARPTAARGRSGGRGATRQCRWAWATRWPTPARAGRSRCPRVRSPRTARRTRTRSRAATGPGVKFGPLSPEAAER